jgi:hypothetical protein
MIAFIDDHRQAHGVEPICKVGLVHHSDSQWMEASSRAA